MKTLGIIALVVSLFVSAGHAGVYIPVTSSMGETGLTYQPSAGENGAVVNSDGIQVGGDK